MASPLIEVRSVTKVFRGPVERSATLREHFFGLFRPARRRPIEALRDVSLEVRTGESIGIMGRNGAGKTTFLRVLCGVLPPDSGSVVRRCAITPILQLGMGWDMHLDAVDNILLNATITGTSLQRAKRSVAEILAFAELEPFANLEVRHFSAGMRARLAFATAFHTVRDVLIVDEALAVGDAAFRERCDGRLEELLGSGRNLVLVSHDPDEIERHCDRGVLLERGRIAFQGTGSEVAAEYRERLTGARNEL